MLLNVSIAMPLPDLFVIAIFFFVGKFLVNAQQRSGSTIRWFRKNSLSSSFRIIFMASACEISNRLSKFFVNSSCFFFIVVDFFSYSFFCRLFHSVYIFFNLSTHLSVLRTGIRACDQKIKGASIANSALCWASNVVKKTSRICSHYLMWNMSN